MCCQTIFIVSFEYEILGTYDKQISSLWALKNYKLKIQVCQNLHWTLTFIRPDLID